MTRRIVRSIIHGMLLCLCYSSASYAVQPRERATPGVPILIYHEIVTDGKEPGETVVSLERFSEQMKFLSENQYTPISIAALVSFMKGGEVPPRPVVLTFDDGWKSVLNAVPILDRYGFRASFWIITEKGIGGDYLDWEGVHALARNPRFEIESHSATHPWDLKNNIVTWMRGQVPGKGIADVMNELAGSKSTLEEHLGTTVRYFAWPCGWYTDSLISLAQSAGYEALLSAEDGMNHPGDDVFRIRRAFIDGACDLSTFEEVLKNGRYRSCQRNGRVTRGHLPEDTR